jgi:hypothetical protein
MSDSDICTTFLLSSWAFTAIVSNWGTQFVSSLWKRVCQLLKIVWRMFTAYHLKTDRATEQMNQNVELYICMFSNYSQNNWASLLLMTELVINNHDFVSTEVSLFFLSHEYHMKPLQLLEKLKPVWSEKFSTESWSNCTKDERSHRVSTDDYDSHSADTEKKWIERDSSLMTSRKKTKSD